MADEPEKGHIHKMQTLKTDDKVERVDVAGDCHELRQVRGPGAPAVHRLEAKTLVVGRSSDADLVLDSAQISRRHLELTKVGDDYRCRDLDSMNGMYVDGVKAVEVILRDGDTVQIGDVVFEYCVHRLDTETT
jgi:pSer/pThr/pTyr-binding forkhead associated (FHA) protein